MLLPRPAVARNHFTLGLGTGTLFLSGSHSQGGLFATLKGGYWLQGKENADSLGLEGVLLHASDPDLFMFRADALYPVFTRSAWKSLLTLGLGGFTAGSEQEPIMALGLALSYQPDTPVSLRLDVRHLREIRADEKTGWEIGLNLGYDFGYQRKPRPRPPADADADGIPDQVDRCPDTPREFKVDAHGCPINPPDGDGDGVPDYLDRCPGTEKGMQVGTDGCPPDSDGDGIPDVEDRCPHNPPGLPVGADGCVEVR